MSKNMAVINDTGLVTNIIVCKDDEPESVNLITYFDDNPAYIGGDYLDGYFYPPQPFTSWTRSEGEWVPPIPRPSEGQWVWDEELEDWIPLSVE